MFKLLRISTFLFAISFLFSISIGEKPLFLYVYKYTKKLVIPIQASAQETLRVGYYRVKAMGEQLFNNNLPEKDILDYKLSAPERQKTESFLSEEEVQDIFGN